MPAPLDTAEGGIALAEEHARITLADCARFRSWALQAPDREAALARIYPKGLPKPPNDQQDYSADQYQALRPFAIILTARQGGFSKGRVATGTYPEAGKLAIVLEENIPADLADDPARVERRFENTVGVIIDELLALAYTAPDTDRQYLAIDIVTFSGPTRCSETERVAQGDHHFAMLELQYGVGIR